MVRDITIMISGEDPILPENFLRAARANHFGGGNNILVVNGHLFKGKDLHCRKFSGKLRAQASNKTYGAIAQKGLWCREISNILGGCGGGRG